jgi:hypothetical protein
VQRKTLLISEVPTKSVADQALALEASRGQAGANCNPKGEGNVLIIQESDKEEPDDNAHGGTFTFTFACPLVELKSVGLIDIDKESKAYFEIFKSGGGRGITQMIHGLGDNSIQTETFDGSVGRPTCQESGYCRLQFCRSSQHMLCSI